MKQTLGGVVALTIETLKLLSQQQQQHTAFLSVMRQCDISSLITKAMTHSAETGAISRLSVSGAGFWYMKI